jgi:hypothetical protein
VAGNHGSWESRFAELYAQAEAARVQTRNLTQLVHANQTKVMAECQRMKDAWQRAEEIRKIWLDPANRDRLRYSAHARLQARLASMPVIEQAKGILMAQCGWSADQAFDALRRASQRENVKLRELAARIVARTAEHPPRAWPGPAPGRQAAPRSGRAAAGNGLTVDRRDRETAG